MLATGNHGTSRPIIDLRWGPGYLRGISPHAEGNPLARKILLADDSVTAQNMGRKILSDAGYEVIAVNNGSAALKKIAEHKPDLIILDVYMPGYSGLEVCQRLKDAQETARIPVLLSVGKLEPFKAEEAQRVRAEAFIVKPFEATELLSALAKLEDKIVPRSEPSKPGRFGRAIAAAEESSRSGREGANDETAWKERISFPGKKKKAEAEQKTPDDSATYNPGNRDLRIVEKPAPEKESKVQEAAEAKVPGNLPGDVTPEEVAAIASAMAQMQDSLGKAQEAEQSISEAQTPETAEQPAVEQVKAESVPADAVAFSNGNAAEGADVPASAAARVAEEPAQVPATMAVTPEMTAVASEPGPRWMAVPAALETEESAILLEQEMQKAYAAFAAAEANHPGFVEPAPPEPAAEISGSAEAVAELPVAVLAESEPETTMSAAAAESAPAFVDAVQPEAEAVGAPANPAEMANTFPAQAEAATFPPSVTEAAPIEAHSGVVAAHEFEQQVEDRVANQEETMPADFAVAAAALAGLSSPEATPVPEPEPELAKAAAASSADAPIAERAPQQEESDRVASSAAAWASWHQIRDAGEAKGKPAETSTPAFEMNAPVPTEAEPAARAVAAGAEQIVQEVSPAPSSSDSIASIVDRVLADLRPRLVEEIARKMAEKK
jgi:CheY-like chemotaxis protein